MTVLEALRDDVADLARRPASPVDVAVLDSGIDGSHPELLGKVVSAIGVDVRDDRPTLVELALGDDNDRYGQGTSVASIVVRLAPNARLHDIRVLGDDPQSTGAALLQGMRIAMAKKARVVLVSFATLPAYAPKLHELCEIAYQQGQVVVAARGSSAIGDFGYPAELSSALAVGRGCFESPYQIGFLGARVPHFLGHGERVPVAAAGGGYTWATGTGFAAAAIGAACAVLLGHHPDLLPFDVKSVLRYRALRPR